MLALNYRNTVKHLNRHPDDSSARGLPKSLAYDCSIRGVPKSFLPLLSEFQNLNTCGRFLLQMLRESTAKIFVLK